MLCSNVMGQRRRHYGRDLRTLQQTRRTGGYYTISVPANIVEAMGWKRGQVLEWRVIGKDRLEVRRVAERVPARVKEG